MIKLMTMIVIVIALIFELIYGGNSIVGEIFGIQHEILPKKKLKLLFSLPNVFTYSRTENLVPTSKFLTSAAGA